MGARGTRENTQIPWTEEEKQLLRQLWQQPSRLSASEIGKSIGRSRSAVIAKARKLGLPARSPPNYKRNQRGARETSSFKTWDTASGRPARVS